VLDYELVYSALLNIQFGDNSGQKWGAAAVGRNATNDYWNWYVHPGEWNATMTNLFWSEGVGSPISMTVANGPGQWANQTGDAMFDRYIYNSSGLPITIELSGIPAGSYDLYLYGHGAADTQYGRFEPMLGGSSCGIQQTAVSGCWHEPIGTWTNGVHYVRYANLVVGTDGYLTVNVLLDGDGYPFINGLQLVANSQLSGLVAHWKLDEWSGIQAADATGRGHTGILAGNTKWTGGSVQGALSFNEPKNSELVNVTVSDAADLQITGDMTIAFWMKLTSDPRDDVNLVGKMDNYRILLKYDGGIQFLQNNQNGVCTDLSSPTINAHGRWAFVAAVVSGNNTTLYIDNRTPVTQTRTGTPAVSTDSLTFGGGFVGLLDEVRIYNRALSAAEIGVLAVLPNQAPVANAGSDQTILLGESATLVGEAMDDGRPGDTLTYSWSLISGPGQVTFTQQGLQVTGATFTSAGTNVIRLTVSDTLLVGTDDVTIIVNPVVDSDNDGLPDSIDAYPNDYDYELPSFTITSPSEGSIF
jgi:hypothetical protein